MICLDIVRCRIGPPQPNFYLYGAFLLSTENLHILELPRSTDAATGSEEVEAIVVGPPNADTAQVDVVVQYPDLPSGARLVTSIALDLFNRWMPPTGGDVVNGTVEGNKIIATGPDKTIIRNLPLDSGEEVPSTIHLDAPTADSFTFQVVVSVNGVDTGDNVSWHPALLPDRHARRPQIELRGIDLPSELTYTLPCVGVILLMCPVLWVLLQRALL